VERGRKKSAPTVDTVAHLPTLSLPLQGGDLRPHRFGRDERLRNKQSTPIALASLPWRGEKKEG
jgi:hypothetical protein